MTTRIGIDKDGSVIFMAVALFGIVKETFELVAF
jgi:hypothetical protein